MKRRHLLPALALLLGACGPRKLPPAQPVTPVGELAQRSMTPSDLEEQAKTAISERMSKRERHFRELYEPGSLWNPLRIEQRDIDRGRIPLRSLVNIGRDLFELDFGPAQGLGNGLAARKSKLAGPGAAPNLRHVHYKEFGGPDGTRCASCHHVGGLGGAGFRADNAFLDGDGDMPASGLERNPRSLMGAALLQRLAEEMTEELQAQVRTATKRIERGKSAPLVAKGVSFGNLTVRKDGSLDALGVRGVSLDFVVRPFGWKGTGTTVREQVLLSLQRNLGVQAEELVETFAKTGRRDLAELLGDGPPEDPDADGITREATTGMVSALTAYIASLTPPIEDSPEWPTMQLRLGRGAAVFERIGCASCHVPELPLEDPVVSLGPTPGSQPRLDLSPLLTSPYKPERQKTVRIYSDLKRHSLGDELGEARGYNGIPKHQFLTPPLWGLSASAPYLHDGRAPTVDAAILAHGGEAAASRDAYMKLEMEDNGSLRVFLHSLGRPQHLECKP